VRKRLFGAVLAFLILVCSTCALAAQRDMAHYLLLGVDGWGANEEGSARSDAIILTSLDYEKDRIIFTSFARDCIVKPSYRKGTVKLNTLVRSAEGETVLIDYIEEAFGVPISGYFIINFSGAVDVIDAIGGVEIDLSAAEVDYLRHHAGDYDGYKLKEGPCLINGAQALYYMRCRGLDNDFGRQGRQGKVLRAVLRELSDITPLQAVLLLDDVLGLYRTNLSGGQQLELALKAIRLRRADVVTHSMPQEGSFRYGTDSHGASGLLFNMETNRESLYALLDTENPFSVREESEKTPESDTH